MNTQPVGPAYHQSLENLLTLWGYEIAWNHAGQIQVFKSGQAHLGYLTAGFAGYDFWTLETWVVNIKVRDQYLSRPRGLTASDIIGREVLRAAEINRLAVEFKLGWAA